VDLRKLVKKGAVMVRQYLRRVSVVERHVRGEGIEIGALQDPQVVPAGVTVRYVDIVSNEDALRAHPRRTAKQLVPVDIVDDGQTLGTIADASQDFVISNHFLEHCQDPLAALSNMLRVVRPGGVVYLTVPDKTRTFDAQRETTTVEHVLRDHRDGPQSSLRDHARDLVRSNGQVAGEEAIERRVDELLARDAQIHFHCWDDAALLEMLLAARRELGLPFAIEEFVRNESEFVVVLAKT
jgi:predicted SAM-dependent methyltransferase